MSLLPAVTRMRGGLRPSPGEYATPRREGAPPVTEYSQMSLPDSVSRATTRLAAVRYMTRFTTIGVASELGPPPPFPLAFAANGRCRPNRADEAANRHRSSSWCAYLLHLKRQPG